MSFSVLPPNPDLKHLRNQAKALLADYKANDLQAGRRMRQALSELTNLSDAEIFQAKLALKDAQRAIARQYGFDEWADLKRHIEALPAADPIMPIDPKIRQQMDKLWESIEEDGWSARKRAEMTPLEQQFVETAMQNWRGELHPDLQRLRALLAQKPTLIDNAGAAALAVSFAGKETESIVQFLVDHGARFEYPKNVWSPLLAAAHDTAYNRWPVDKFRTVYEAGLADAGEVGIEAPSGHTFTHRSILTYAAYFGHSELAELALQHGGTRTVDTNRLNQRDTALQLAAKTSWRDERRAQVVEVLLAHGVYCDIFSACALGDDRRLRQSAAVDALHAARTKTTPLHWAAAAGAIECAKILLAHGAEVDARDSTKETPLHRAGTVEVLWLLAESGADLNPQDNKGRTPLHLATFNGKIEIAEVLIVLGASIRIKNCNGKTPLQVAQMDCRHLKPA
ncbi:MAG: hypothetical protein GKR89_33990 [Candidatus Latescibacteria bacterium]|nr:hypothetical protein [Candidatus Latescibacterota bacterium]